MNHRKFPALPSALRTPPVWLVPGLVVAIVAGLLWFSFGVGPGGPQGSIGLGAQSTDESRQTGGEHADTSDLESAKSEDDEKGTKSGTEPPAAEPTSSTTSPALERSVRRFQAAQRRLAERVNQQLERRTQPFSFRVATFNVLGDSHTGPGGNKPGFPDGSPRMDMAISALRSSGIDVVGFQEFEASQYNMFTARAGEYSLYPGLAMGDKSVRFNIAWRSSMFRMVDAHTLSIPYAGGSRIEMPVVLLESISTGRRAWFANFHNPADTPNLGNNGRWRAEAAAIEVSHLTALHQEQGIPVIATGDYNEREEIFCRFTAGGVFSAAAGGSSAGGCAPPSGMQVDWIFGSTGVQFDSYAVSGVGKASDHNMVHSGATLLPAG
ncbi:endonuclease/exonuclease/phosphatase family protein [Nocardioides sp.]|uniref:endonuclease/exonuclease/phosphatase family protein n=1 Tax=Nocardioides sp. TaxID=35761 RepID=UPI0035B0DFB0